MRQKHPIPPLYDKDSEILILGSFPSVRSREANFFYGHPQNRFWKVLSGVYGEKIPETVEEKKALVLSHHLAMWDVISECDIIGSSDSSIRDAKANDISVILDNARIRRIIVNGKTAGKMYDRYLFPKTSVRACLLPSTSPANATWTIDRLIDAWKEGLEG